MDTNKVPSNAVYRHVVLEGTAYECGRSLGCHIHSRSGPEYGMYAGQIPGLNDLTDGEMETLLRLNDRYCPGINDEMRGLADGLGVDLRRLAARMRWHSQSGFCSHIAALPGATADGHVLAARSYEWSRDDALCLITARVRGKYRHIGFSLFACGRFDGLNEKGLCVTMSAGAPGKKPTSGGFPFWASLRAVLDSCAGVAEAVELLSAMPSCFYVNYILSDREGNAALVEDACGHRSVKRIGPGSQQHYLFSANHFTLPGTAERGDAPMWMSRARSQRMERALAAASPKITKESLKALLTAPVPEGLSCHLYNDGFGTLWSMLFDATAASVDISFGPPDANAWHTFGLDDPPGVTEYSALLPDEACADPRFFSRTAD